MLPDSNRNTERFRDPLPNSSLKLLRPGFGPPPTPPRASPASRRHAGRNSLLPNFSSVAAAVAPQRLRYAGPAAQLSERTLGRHRVCLVCTLSGQNTMPEPPVPRAAVCSSSRVGVRRLLARVPRARRLVTVDTVSSSATLPVLALRRHSRYHDRLAPQFIASGTEPPRYERLRKRTSTMGQKNDLGKRVANSEPRVHTCSALLHERVCSCVFQRIRQRVRPNNALQPTRPGFGPPPTPPLSTSKVAGGTPADILSRR